MAVTFCRSLLFRTSTPTSWLIYDRTNCLVQCVHDSKTDSYVVQPERLKEIENSPSGWVPPLDQAPAVPFAIRRSRLNNIPVYTDIKGGGNKTLTIIRKVKGDLEALEILLKSKLGKELIVQRNELTGQVKIKGNHKDSVVSLLKELGF